jgi:uncharacterized protein (TIGR00106 family)
MATASITVGANTGEGTREYVAIALDVLDRMGIHYELMATNVEGDVETICATLAAIHKRCHELGARQVESLLTIDDRIDVAQTLESKVSHVIEARKRLRK